MNRHFIFKLTLLFVWACIASACDSQPTQEKAQTSTASAIKKGDTLAVRTSDEPESLRDLFTYHKQFNVNDTITFDVLGWGADTKGSYLILKSNRYSNQYLSISGQRQGKITDAFIADMDADLQAEVTVVTRNQADNKGVLYTHEIDSLNQQTAIALPDLSPELQEGYAGKDTFYVAKEKLVREFSLQNETAGKRRIEYTFRNNTFILSGNKDQ